MHVLVAAAGPLSGSGYATRVNSMIDAYIDRGWRVDLLHVRREGEAPAFRSTAARVSTRTASSPFRPWPREIISRWCLR